MERPAPSSQVVGYAAELENNPVAQSHKRKGAGREEEHTISRAGLPCRVYPRRIAILVACERRERPLGCVLGLKASCESRRRRGLARVFTNRWARGSRERVATLQRDRAKSSARLVAGPHGALT